MRQGMRGPTGHACVRPHPHGPHTLCTAPRVPKAVVVELSTSPKPKGARKPSAMPRVHA